MPPAATKSNMAKISKSYILTPPHPQGHVMSVKCEEPLDELTVQVWLLYHHPNFKYCTLLVSGTELRTDRRTNGRMDGRTIRLLDAPGGPFRPGHKNTRNMFWKDTLNAFSHFKEINKIITKLISVDRRNVFLQSHAIRRSRKCLSKSGARVVIFVVGLGRKHKV